MSAPTHGCNWPGCSRRIRREHYACDAHWWIIPLRLRVALSRAWARYRKAMAAIGPKPTTAEGKLQLLKERGAELAEVGESVLAYRQASQAVVDFAKGKR